MSKKGAPRKSFTSYVVEQKADPITLEDDDGNVLLSVPRPQFWSKDHKRLADNEDGVALFGSLCGEDEFAAFVEAIGETPDVSAQLAMAYIVETLGGNPGESSASSTS